MQRRSLALIAKTSQRQSEGLKSLLTLKQDYFLTSRTPFDYLYCKKRERLVGLLERSVKERWKLDFSRILL